MVAAFFALSFLIPDTQSLFFAAVQRRGETVASTPAQVVFLEAPDASVKTAWVAVSTQPWLSVSPQSGNGPARLAVQLARAIPAGARSGDTGQIRLRFADGSPDAVIASSLTLLADRSAAPVGSLDTPAEGFVGTDGFVRLSGWALDDVELSRIEICADGPPAPSARRCSDNTRTFLGEARPHQFARPDVAAIFPSTPLNGRAAWSFVLSHDALPRGHRGPAHIVVTAYDSEGAAAVLGGRTITLKEPPAQTSAVVRGLIALAVFLAFHAALGAWLLKKGPAILAPGARPASRIHPVEAVLLLAALVGAAIADAHGLSRGFSYDEMFSASHFIVDTPLVASATRTVTFNNHYAFSVLSGIAARVLGNAEWALRFPAVLLGMTGIVVSWWFARSLAGPSAGVAAAVVLALMPGFVEWSQSARGYSGLALTTVWSTYAFTSAVRTGSRRAAAAHAAALILAFYFHLYAAWLFAIQYLAFALRAIVQRYRPAAADRPLGPLWWSFCAAAIGTFIVYLPMVTDLTALMQTRQRTDAIDPNFPLALLNAYAGKVPLAVLLMLAVLLVAGLQRVGRTLEGWLMAATVVAPLALVWLVVRPVDLQTRYVAFVLPIVAVLLGIGAASIAGFVVARTRRTATPAPLLPTLAVTMVLVVLPAAAWARVDAAPPVQAGLREALSMPGPRTGGMVYVGADAEMFDYYLGKPVGTAHVPADLDRIMRDEADVTVIYHDVPWNTPDQRQIVPLLRRRCEETAGGSIARFRCH